MLKPSLNIKAEQHPFHLVKPSPWPFFVGQGAFLFLLVFTLTVMHNEWYSSLPVNSTLFGLILNIPMLGYILGKIVFFLTNCVFAKALTFMLLLLFLYSWFADIVTEAVYEGNHTQAVQTGLRYGMVLFIVSEVMFFFSFFWAFFHFSTATAITISGVWTPIGIDAISPFGIPLLNTGLLLLSGCTVTWAHHAILAGNRFNTTLGLSLTILLGAIFTGFQIFEYNEAGFAISSGAYGSVFFVATGFHGLHVLIGTIFLFVCLIRHILYHFTTEHHFGFEAAAWYWHFVDVVWLFLFIMIYWWGY